MPIRHNTVPRPTLSPDGRLVAVLDGGPGIHLFERATGKELRTFGDGTKTHDCRFSSPDGTKLLAITHGPVPYAKGFNVKDASVVFETTSHRIVRDRTVGVWNDRNVFFTLTNGPAVGDKQPLLLRVIDAATGKELKAFETGVTDFFDERGIPGGGFPAFRKAAHSSRQPVCRSG